MGKKEKKQSEQLSLEQQKISNQLLQADIKRQEAIFQQIKPLADFLLKMGINPIEFFQTPQGAALLAPQREALGANFDQQRQNAIDLFAGTGFSPGSGQAAGPLANLFGQEASAQSNLLYTNIANALGLGIQGGNLLNQQQAVFNPFQAAGIGSNAAQNIAEGGGIWKALIGAAGSALGGLTGNLQKKPGSSNGGGGQPSCCWVATELYGWMSPEMVAVRDWLEATKFWTPFVWFYRRIGPAWAQKIRKYPRLRRPTKALFDFFLKQARGF